MVGVNVNLRQPRSQGLFPAPKQEKDPGNEVEFKSLWKMNPSPGKVLEKPGNLFVKKSILSHISFGKSLKQAKGSGNGRKWTKN